jgi:hypothetical protein
MIRTALRDSLGIGRARMIPGRTPSARRRFRPAVLNLEDRQLFSRFTWHNSSGGDFGNAQNWIDQNGHHGIPGAADTAIIKGSGLTVSINQSTRVGSLISNARIAINGPTLTLDHPFQSSSIANLDFRGGTIDLAGTLSIPRQFRWSGGTLGGCGTAVVEPGAIVTIVTSATSSLQNDAVLANHGTVTWREAGGQISGRGTINNSGTFNIDGKDPQHQVYSNPIDGTFNNHGSLLVDGALPAIDSLSSTGTIDVTNSGYLTINGNATLAGVMNVAWGATVSFADQGRSLPGMATVKPGAVFGGSGFYSVWDGEKLVLDTNVAPTNFLVAGGSVTGSGTLTVTGYLQFSGGQIAPAVVHVPAGATFHIDDYYDDSGSGWTLSAGTVNLAGQTVWAVKDAGNLVLGSSTIINNLSSGDLTIQTDNAMVGGTLNNRGLIVKTRAPGGGPGSGTTTIVTTLNNAGTVQVNSGTLNLAGPVAQVSGARLTGGSWKVANATGAGAVLTISSAGGITTIGPGTSVMLDGPSTTFTNLASLAVNEGAFSLLGGQSFGTQGPLGNYGVISLGAGDALVVDGNYGQAAGASLDMTIAGRSSSGLVRDLGITGDADFGRAVNITVPSGFVPVFDDRYVLMSYRHVRSFFGAINIWPLGGGEYLGVNYLPQAFYLRVR